MLSEPWCKCNANGKGKLMRAYSTEVMSEVIQSIGVGCEGKDLDAT